MRRNGSQGRSCGPGASRGRPNDGRLGKPAVYGDRKVGKELGRNQGDSSLSVGALWAPRGVGVHHSTPPIMRGSSPLVTRQDPSRTPVRLRSAGSDCGCVWPSSPLWGGPAGLALSSPLCAHFGLPRWGFGTRRVLFARGVAAEVRRSCQPPFGLAAPGLSTLNAGESFAFDPLSPNRPAQLG